MPLGLKVHFVGIGGSGVSASAAIAHFSNFQVTGCDFKKDSQYLQNFPKTIAIENSHSPNHLQDKDLLVVTPAILKLDPNNDELIYARKNKIPILTWQQFMGKFLQKGKIVIAVTGSHGKSTTTAMIGHILEDANLDPTVEIGAIDLLWQTNFKVGKGQYFVCEADEYNDNFLNYKANFAIITNIELDHPDFFTSFQKLFASFGKFVNQLKTPALLFVNKKNTGIATLLAKITKNQRINIVECEKTNINLQIIGNHNINNAQLAFCLARKLGIGEKIITKSLSQFKGVGQRLEKKGIFFGADLYSDYAVHPTEIDVVLKTLHKVKSQSKIFAVFEPHTFSRLNYFFADFSYVFTNNKVRLIVTDTFAAREKTGKFKPNDLANAVKNASYLQFRDIAKTLKMEIKRGDIIVVLGAGNSYKIVDSLLKLGSKG